MGASRPPAVKTSRVNMARAGPGSELDGGDYAPRMVLDSSGNAVVGELDAPELAGWIEHLQAEFEDAGIFGVADADDAKFLCFLGYSVQNFDAGAQAGFQRSTNQRATAAHSDGFGESNERLAIQAVAEELHRDANEDARRAAAF